jgi:hypothetical protein
MSKKVKNFLGKVEEVKAPKRWKSSPDAPPTQLAYVTQPEIDMLVKANIHGSMKGKPNMGPKGIISLDGGGDYAAETKTDKNKKGASTGASQVQATQQDQQNFAAQVASQGGTSAYENFQATQEEKNKLQQIRNQANQINNTTPEEEKKGKTAEEIAQEKAQEASKFLVNWWDKNNKNKYRTYGDRKNLFGGGVRNTKEKVQAKIADKLNKGYYKIVNGPDGQPLIIHASTGTPVNPYTGGIIDTQSESAQGGGYQNEMAKITGVDPKNAGVFSREYQTGNGLPVSEMKPEHALRFLMSKNKGAFEQFFELNKEKPGFNPFSFSAIGTAFGSILNKITGPEALQVGNNLERAGWGKAVQQPDGSYKLVLSEKGANNWSKTFDWNTTDIAGTSFSNFISPEAVAKDQSKTFLGNFISGSKFNEQPIDLSNLVNVGGTVNPANITAQSNPLFDPTDPMSPNFNQNIGNQDFVQPPPLVSPYPFVQQSDLRDSSQIPGTPPSQYPAFTPEGFRINAYNPSLNLGGSNQGGQSGQGGQGGQGGQDDSDTNTQGDLTYNVFGLPVNYDYTGGPERMMLGGGFKRDGQYIGPFNYKNGGIANFRGYGY